MFPASKRFSALVFLILLTVIVGACTPSGGNTSGGNAPAATTAPSGGAAATTAPATEAQATSAITGTAQMTATTSGAGSASATAAVTGTATLSETTPAAGAAPAAAHITLPASCTNVQLQYWTPFTGPDGPFMRKLVDQFNSANPQIKVNMVTQPDYVTKLSTAAASDTLPDVTVVNEDQIATQAYNHVIRALDNNMLSQLGVSENDFPQAAWAMGTVSGKQYAIPLSIVPMTMYYNQDLLAKAGVSAPPANAQDFAKVAAAMTQGNTHGFMITTGFPVQQIFQQLLHQYGGAEFNQDATQATYNSEAGVKALQWMKDAQQKYSQPKLPVDADLNAFKAGQAGMIWNGIWQLANVTGNAVSFKSGATAVPQIGDQPAVWAGEATLSLTVHKKGYDQCKDAASLMLIRYLLDHSADWAQAGNIPALNVVRNSSQFKGMEPYASIAPSVEHPTFLPPGVPGIADAFGPLGDAVGAIMSGNATDIKATLDSAAKRSDQVLAQNKQKFGAAP